MFKRSRISVRKNGRRAVAVTTAGDRTFLAGTGWIQPSLTEPPAGPPGLDPEQRERNRAGFETARAALREARQQRAEADVARCRRENEAIVSGGTVSGPFPRPTDTGHETVMPKPSPLAESDDE